MTPKKILSRMVISRDKIRKQTPGTLMWWRGYERTEGEIQWEEWPRPGFHQLRVIKWCCTTARLIPNVANTFGMIFIDLHTRLDHKKQVSKHIVSTERTLQQLLCAISLNHDSSRFFPNFFFGYLGFSFWICLIEIKRCNLGVWYYIN